MKNRIIFTLSFLLLSFFAFGQSVRLADRYYREFSYIKSSELYKSRYNKGDKSFHVMERIAKSYYNNSQVENSKIWYSKLVEEHKTKVTDDHLFEFAQSLRSSGDYEKSDSLLATLPNFKLKNVTKKTTFLLNPKNRLKVSVKNLKINTEFSDFGGFLFDEKVYYASSAPIKGKKSKLYNWNKQPFLNLYSASTDVEVIGETADKRKVEVYVLKENKILPSPITTQYHESNAIFTKDGKTMYFSRLNSSNGRSLDEDNNDIVNLKIYKSNLLNEKWSDVEELPFNSKHYSVAHPALSLDEKHLYFVSDMPGSFGETDIYKVAITENGYGKPQNLGKTINTAGKEMFPFVSVDNTLYFSSDGHAGIGLLDIFQSRISENGASYSTPSNLQAPFNSKRDDFSLYIDNKGQKGFFTSNRDGGKGDDDIYSFMLEDMVHFKPISCLQNISGIVTSNLDNSIIPFAAVKLIDSNGKVVKEILSDEKGFYSFSDIICGQEFTIRSSKLNYKPEIKKISTTKQSGKTIIANLALNPLVINNEIVIKPIYFNFDKYDIREDAKYELEYIVTVMNNNPKMVIKIESHTDSRASKSYNRRLSTNRAKSTRNYILSRGIDPKRIVSARGYGEDKLLNHCNDANINKCSEEEHQLNRRSYFIIVDGAPNVKVNNIKPTVIDRKSGK